jgi:hypothetical protein
MRPFDAFNLVIVKTTFLFSPVLSLGHLININLLEQEDSVVLQQVLTTA